MQTNTADNHSIHVHYSPTAQYSIGYRGEYWPDDDWQFHGLQLNNLIRRWNRPASQANVYLKSGIGIVITDDKHDLASFTGVAVDWESRRFFAAYENRWYEAGHINRFFSQKARIGIAPYIGNYGDLHTWLMLQINHAPEREDAVTLTPLIRLFKNEYLIEFGVNDRGRALINFIVRL